MTPTPRPKSLSRAAWNSILASLAGMTGLAILGVTFDSSLAALSFGVLTALGLPWMIGLIEAAKAEEARGISEGRYIPRFLVLAVALIGYLIGTCAIAIGAGLPPSPLVWILAQVLSIAPAVITAAILTGRTHRLPLTP